MAHYTVRRVYCAKVRSFATCAIAQAMADELQEQHPRTEEGWLVRYETVVH